MAAAAIDPSPYSHSPAHAAVLARDYVSLRRLLSSLPRLAAPSTVLSEHSSLSEESKADSIAAVIDRRDVPGRETPLHLAVRLADPTAAEMLMCAGADWSLQNDQGWSPLQESICAREETLARIIVRHYQPLAWAKWCRRLPRLTATMRRMRDFYMEITFHFESSVIPFVSRIAPSDTYKIWKRGPNLRADMTLAGFDGFRIQRSDQTILFLGEGSDNIPAGSLCMISHKDKEVMNVLNGAAAPASEEEIQQEVAAMSRTNIFRPGIDVTQAILLPQLNWRRQERSESVGAWKANVYDMHHVVVSVRSRRVPGAVTDDELFATSSSNENDGESEFDDVLTEEERRQLEATLKLESPDTADDGSISQRRSCCEERRIPIDDGSSCASSSSRSKQGRKGWFGGWGKGGNNPKQEQDMPVVPPRSSLCVDEKVSDLLGDSPPNGRSARHSVELAGRMEGGGRGSDRRKEGSKESEYKKGLRPTLWLSPSFPLRTEELLPLLDILANKVKAIRRLRELLTTKLPPGTFPVKVAIPVIPTIRVLVTFTKFEELQTGEEFSTPPSSPESKSPVIQPPSSSWLQWIKAPYRQNQSATSGPSSRVEDIQDPFVIPPDYTWTTPEARKKKIKDTKGKSKKG